jgi:hypothetical protein
MYAEFRTKEKLYSRNWVCGIFDQSNQTKGHFHDLQTFLIAPDIQLSDKVIYYIREHLQSLQAQLHEYFPVSEWR